MDYTEAIGAIEELKAKAEALDKIENLDATIRGLEERVGKLQAKHDHLVEETKVPSDTREYEAMTYTAIKNLHNEIETIKANTTPKPITKEEILSIKDRSKRLKAIEDNFHLFKGETDSTHTV